MNATGWKWGGEQCLGAEHRETCVPNLDALAGASLKIGHHAGDECRYSINSGIYGMTDPSVKPGDFRL